MKGEKERFEMAFLGGGAIWWRCVKVNVEIGGGKIPIGEWKRKAKTNQKCSARPFSAVIIIPPRPDPLYTKTLITFQFYLFSRPHGEKERRFSDRNIIFLSNFGKKNVIWSGRVCWRLTHSADKYSARPDFSTFFLGWIEKMDQVWSSLIVERVNKSFHTLFEFEHFK